MAKKPITAVIKWDEELAKEAKAAAANEKDAGFRKFITHKDGTMKFDGSEIPDNEISVVILGVLHENQWYEESYKEGEMQVPACFALAESEDALEPHEKSTKPQSEACEGCPLNEWGSADVGEGKACKNVRRFAMIAASDLEDVEHAEVVFMKLPVTSVKNWVGYLKKTLEKVLQRPYWSVTTKISLDGKVFDFAFDEKIDDSLLQSVREKHKKVLAELSFPYEPIPEGAKKKVVKKEVKKSKFTRK